VNAHLLTGLALAAFSWTGGAISLHLIYHGATPGRALAYAASAALAVAMLWRLQRMGARPCSAAGRPAVPQAARGEG
jgi:hypothetical protein